MAQVKEQAQVQIAPFTLPEDRQQAIASAALIEQHLDTLNMALAGLQEVGSGQQQGANQKLNWTISGSSQFSQQEVQQWAQQRYATGSTQQSGQQ